MDRSGVDPRSVAGLLREEPDRPDDRDDEADPEEELHLLAPVPGAAPVDHVLLEDVRALLAEERRPREPAAHRDVEEAPERDDREERRENRQARAPARLLLEEHEEHRARQQRNDGRRTGQPPPLVGELARRVWGAGASRAPTDRGEDLLARRRYRPVVTAHVVGV